MTDVEPAPADRDSGYGLNVGRFIADHPAYVITAGPFGSGYAARRRDRRGEKLTALTLDQLADLIRREDRS